MPNFITEDQIEQALLQRLQHVCGFDVLECYTADPADLNDTSGRKDKRDVLLPLQLKAEIVDYYNVFRNMKKALKDYAQGEDGLDEPPVRDKEALFQLLDDAVEQTLAYCTASDIGLRDVLAHGELLDESVVVNNAEGFSAKEFDAQYQIIKRGRTWDLSRIDFDKLRQNFGTATYKNIEIADLRGFIARKLELMLEQNSTRGSFAQRFQAIIDNYNARGPSTEQYFEQLVQFSQDMRAEDERATREGLSEDELEIFDLLRKDAMTAVETQKVKLAAKALLHRLLEEQPKVLVQDWFKTDQTRRIVRSAVAEVLDRELPVESYDRGLFQSTCDNVFHLVLDQAAQGRKWTA
jgi:type I restriction enzyme R subunit